MKVKYTGSLLEFYKKNKDELKGEFILLDSPNKNKLSEFSYLLGNFSIKVRVKDKKVLVNNKEQTGEAFDILRKILNENKPDNYEKKPWFTGGLAGIVSYDYNRYIENLPDLAKDDLNLPDLAFVLPQSVIVKDERTEELYIYDYRDTASNWNFDRVEEKIEIEHKEISFEDLDKFDTNISKERFEEIVDIAKSYIKEGDIFQVNLSQRFGAPIKDGESILLYEILRKINPSPFASLMYFDDCKLISQSPERLVRLKDGIADTRPIAGTRRLRKGDEVENLRLEEELKNDPKECAEHVMLVDLERNDIGKVSEFGSVEVDEFMIIERYSHVMHLVSNVKGRLKEGKDAFDLLEAMFPGGTITGAPKIRTMEIIEELENTRRGFYTGSIGFVDFSGDMDFNIIIRSFVEKDNMVYFQVGAGIVYDSVAEREYKETINKARAMILAYENLKNYRN